MSDWEWTTISITKRTRDQLKEIKKSHKDNIKKWAGWNRSDSYEALLQYMMKRLEVIDNE